MVKDGYKQTDIGVIPKDWEIKELRKFGEFSKGKGVKKDESLSGEIPCIRYGEIYTHHNDYIKKFNSFISKELSFNTKKIKNGDILFAGSGETKEEIGKCVAFINDFEAYAGGDIVILSPKDVNSLFLGYVLNTSIVNKQKSSKGQGDAVVHISAKSLENIQIPIPPKEEQKAIAKALSDTDELITSLEKLISKKEAIKQGTMQQLLTGKKRLNGFSGEWEEKRLGNLCEMSSGGTPSTKIPQYYNGNIPWLSISDITDAGKYIFNTERKLTSLGIQNSSARLFSQGTLLLAMYASIGKCCIAKVEISTSQAILGINTNSKIDIEFLYYYFLLSRDKLANSGQQGTQSNLNKGMVEDIKLDLPKVVEQQAISKILSDMDNEIETLKSKLSKTKAIKDGIMSELLTGKTRLKVKDE